MHTYRGIHFRAASTHTIPSSIARCRSTALQLNIQGITEKTERFCHPLGVKVICSSRGKLRETLVKVKEPMPELKRKGFVYEVLCNDCDHVYIGETGRTLEKRLKEHRSAVKKNDRKNGIAVHAWDTGHQVKWESASVKEVETNLPNRRIMEALHIQ